MAGTALKVEIRDQLDNLCVASVDRNEPVHRILPSIVEHMNLPKVGLDGQALRYSLEVRDHRNPHFTRRLAWDDTADVAGLHEGDVLLVFAEMIAG